MSYYQNTEVAFSFKVKVERRELIRALSLASSVIDKRNVLMELSHVKLAIVNEGLEIASTDGDIHLTQYIGAEVMEVGETTVAVKVLLDIVRKILDNEIHIIQYLGQENVEIRGKNCVFNLLSLSAEKFPTMNEVGANTSLEISSKDLAKLIDRSQFSMSSDETRYNLNGIYLHTTGNNKLCAAATDGHRLAVSQVNFAKGGNQELGVILPLKTVEEVLKIVKEPKNIDSNVVIYLGTNKVKFVCNKLSLVSKLIDGTFPEYSSFIPHQVNNEMRINRVLFLEAIERVSTVTVDKFRAVRLSWLNNSFEISAFGESIGNALEVINYSNNAEEFCSFVGEGGVVGFNPKYITDILRSLDSALIEMRFSDASSPALIKCVEENSNDIFVVMPIKV